MNTSAPFIKGTLDSLVLKALSELPRHGFEIVTWIESRSRGHLEITDSALYQALYRMESRGLVSAEWGVTENNRRARFYSIEPAGRRHLETEISRWVTFADTVTGILTDRLSAGEEGL